MNNCFNNANMNLCNNLPEYYDFMDEYNHILDGNNDNKSVEKLNNNLEFNSSFKEDDELESNKVELKVQFLVKADPNLFFCDGSINNREHYIPFSQEPTKWYSDIKNYIEKPCNNFYSNKEILFEIDRILDKQGYGISEEGKSTKGYSFIKVDQLINLQPLFCKITATEPQKYGSSQKRVPFREKKQKSFSCG